MGTIRFGHAVKYNGRYYAPNAPIAVPNKAEPSRDVGVPKKPEKTKKTEHSKRSEA